MNKEEIQDKAQVKIDNMAEQKELSLEDFLSKSKYYLDNREDVKCFSIAGFGRIPFNRPSDDELLKYITASAKGATLDENGEAKMVDMTPIAVASKALVYNSCAYLHNKELLEKAEVEEPYDITFKLFGINETIDLAGKISDEFGSRKVLNKIKN